LLRPPPPSTLFPYTTLFRSRLRGFDLRVQFPDLLLQSRRPPVAPAQPDQASCQRDRSDYPCYVAHSSLLYVGAPYAGHSRDPCRSEEHTSELQSPDHLVCCL